MLDLIMKRGNVATLRYIVGDGERLGLLQLLLHLDTQRKFIRNLSEQNLEQKNIRN